VVTMCWRKALQSVNVVFTLTLFSHSNSAHMFLPHHESNTAVRTGTWMLCSVCLDLQQAS
jgi:hypothetical protein